MIIRKFNNKKDIEKFKKDYSEGDITTEVISNLLQPYYETKFPVIKSYMNFLFCYGKEEQRGLILALQMMISNYQDKSLEEKFGKCDFKFTGNRKYNNYILNFDGLTVIVPEKRSFVIEENKEIDEELVMKLINFEKEFTQLVVDYILSHQNEISSIEMVY